MAGNTVSVLVNRDVVLRLMSTIERKYDEAGTRPIPDDKPVRLTIILSAELAALLPTYADAIGSSNSSHGGAHDPAHIRPVY